VADVPSGLSLTRPHERKEEINPARRQESVEVGGYLFNDTGSISGQVVYEGESVNRPQMDIKRKTCGIRT
jgi:hypothetical protein